MNNNYPAKIIDNEFERFLKFKSSLVIDNNIVEKEIKNKYISLSYVNDNSEVIGSKIIGLVKEYYPKIRVRIAIKTPAQLGDHFHFKDKVEDPSKQANVVYHFKFLNYEEDYIGKTSRICCNRMREHEHSVSTSL